MTLLDYTKNCTIFDKFLVDDLSPYDLLTTNNNLNIKYTVDNTQFPVNFRLDELISIKNSSNTSPVIGTWNPIWITHDNYVNNRLLSSDGAIQNANRLLTSGRLGIEDFITFKPKLTNWTVTDSVDMSIDWYLNQASIPYNIQYGIMGWYKILSNTTENPNNPASLDKFPIGSRLVCNTWTNNTNIILIKLDNNTLYRLDKDDSLWSNNGSELLLSFDKTYLVKLSDLGSSPTFSLSSPRVTGDTSILGNKSLLWIGDGDLFCYFDSEQHKQIEYTNNISSQSYISPSLYKIYSNIYNIITSRYIKKFTGMNLRLARAYKKIASVLSTSPVSTEFGINALHDKVILDHIEAYIADNTIVSVVSEINSINTLLSNINSRLQLLNDSNGTAFNLGYSLSNKTQTNNYIYNKDQLFKKLLNKYGASLRFGNNSDVSLQYNTALQYGDSIRIQQSYKNLCSKTLSGQRATSIDRIAPTTVFNNIGIELNSIKIQTDISDSNTSISMIHNDTNKSLPLSTISKYALPSFSVNIVMETTSDVKGKYRSDGLDEQTIVYWSPNNYIFKTQRIGDQSGQPFDQQQIELKFKILDLLLADSVAGVDSESINSKVIVRWEQESGPCLKFGDTNKTPKILNRTINPLYYTTNYDYSTDIEPSVFVKKTGEYTIKCTVSTPNGTFIKKKTFYVVNGIQEIAGIQNTAYGKYAPKDSIEFPLYFLKNDGTVVDGISPPTQFTTAGIAALPLEIISSNLKVMCPSFYDIAIHKNGLFWPIKTDLEYLENSSAISSIAMSSKRLEGTVKFNFNNPENPSATSSNSTLKLKYTTNNTTIKLIKITLKNIRNHTDECSQCDSMYTPSSYGYTTTIPGSTGVKQTILQVVRGQKYPDEIILYKYIWNHNANTGTLDKNLFTFAYPQISTNSTLAPSMATYGGYSIGVIENLGVTIKDHAKPPPNSPTYMEGVAENAYTFPSTTGYTYSYGQTLKPNDYRLCYQKSTPPTGYVEFTKGVFHPESGWIKYPSTEYDSHANRSSVLKFNPGARDSLNFTGPGLYNIKSNYDINFQNVPTVYKSAITLNIAPESRWDPLSTCEEISDSVRSAQNTKNQKLKESADQDIQGSNGMNHGYRYLAGGLPKEAELSRNKQRDAIDEFGFDFSLSTCSAGDFDNTKKAEFIYSFPVTGPANPIGSTELRNPRINNAIIQDIEVKLNFLNYVNTKNLVIWLDVIPSAQERSRFTAIPNPACPVNPSREFLNQYLGENYHSYINSCSSLDTIHSKITSGDLSNYLYSLTNMNSTYTNQNQPMRLYLLNQEHIQNNDFNFSIKFTDHAPNINVLSDQNISSTGSIIDQQIIKNDYEISPTISATGYSDDQSVDLYHIIKSNQLNITNNKFAKFKNKPLFISPVPEDNKGCGESPKQKDVTYDSSTSFILNIMVLHEYDEMRSYDMVNNNNFYNGYEDTTIEQRSADIVNSLCSWELTLHTGKTKKYTVSNGNGLNDYGNTDILGLIEYGNDPKYPGYNFIADMSNKKYLIPRVNQNAPYVYINDSPLCDFADPTDKPKLSLLLPPVWPQEALPLIGVGMLAGVIAGGGSAIGVAMGFGAAYFIGYNYITDFFNNLSLFNDLNDKARFLYFPTYDQFPFGSPEKVLLNVSKDGGLWYKLEASIFNYKNSVSLSSNKYNFIKLSKNFSGSAFTEFDFKTIQDPIKEITKDFIEVDITDSFLENQGCSGPIYENPTIDNIVCLEPIAQLKRGSIFKVSITANGIQNITEEENNEEISSQVESLNGLYIIDSSTNTPTNNEQLVPIKLTMSNLKKLILSKNLLANNNLCSLLGLSQSNNYLIKIKGKIPFYIFDPQDELEAYDSDSSIKAKVIAKSIIIQDNIFYTILAIDTDISEYSHLAPCSNDVIMVFKPQTTKISDADEYPINVWSFEKDQIIKTPPNNQFSTVGLGSYGDGSQFRKKQLLSYKLQTNNLNKLYDILNNHINDKIKYNDMTIFTIDNQIIPVNNTDGSIGYACSLKDFINEIFLNNGFDLIRHPNMTSVDYEKLLGILKNKTRNIKDTSMEIMFLKSKSLTSHLANIDYGFITFDQDYIKNSVSNNLTQSDIDKIVNRINALEINNQSIKNLLGSQSSTQNIINVGSIGDLETHYNKLKEDAIECYSRSNTSNSSCYKKLTLQALSNRHKERNELLNILSIKSTKSIDKTGTVSYTALPDNSNIIPHTQVSVVDATQDTNNTTGTGALTVNYQDISDKYYWINVDSKQSCSLAEDVSIKVLTKTVYKCTFANSIVRLTPKNNVCPSTLKGINSGGVENVSIIAGNPPIAPETEITYTIPQQTVDNKKSSYMSQYPSIAGWRTYIIERSFFINDDYSNPGSQDILVKATETYEIAIPCHMAAPIDKLDSSCIKNDGSSDVNRVEGGFGLAAPGGGRVGVPSRVYNIFNLDDTQNLKVQFRKVPRQIRGIDYYNTVYKYGNNGSSFRPNTAFESPPELSSGFSLNNNFYTWECMDTDENNKLTYSTVPPLLRMHNEMMFRAFFGSVDGIENKEEMLKSLSAWELIPYEYDFNIAGDG